MTRFHQFWNWLGRSYPVLLLIAGGALMVFFGLRAFRHMDRVRGPKPVDVEALRGWMTMPHVARMYGVPEAELYAVLQVPAEGNAGLSLAELVEKYQLEPEAARRAIERVIQKYPPPPTPPLRLPPP